MEGARLHAGSRRLVHRAGRLIRRSKAVRAGKSMRLAPGIRHDEAALRTRLETFLEAIAVIWRNDRCPAFVRSCRHFEGEGGQNSAEEEKHQAKQLAAVARGARYFGNRQDQNRHGNLKNWREPGGYSIAKALENSLNAPAATGRQAPCLTNRAFRAHSHQMTRLTGACRTLITITICNG